jgi:hypothetical protein
MTTPTNRLTQLANMDWPWKSEDPSIFIILISDEQFVNLAGHPDEAVEKMYPWADEKISLREYCRSAAERGASTLRLAYDYFFGGSERSLYPDTEAFQATLKKVHDVAAEYGIGLEPSVLSPLELGVGYHAKTGESGRWFHYREGLRDPQTGAYSVMLWQQTQWCNNKGPLAVTLAGIRAFAFREQRIPNSSFFAVDPAAMVELPVPQVEELPGANISNSAQYKATRIRVYGEGGPVTTATEGKARSSAGIVDDAPGRGQQAAAEDAAPPLDRVLVVLVYETVEMDYFSPNAAQFLDELVQDYHDRGIGMTGIYADETHIQQDWSYHDHMDNGQFAVRYVSRGFEKAFAARFGSQYADLASYMVYFTAHQHDFLNNHDPKLPSQHVFGPTPDDVAATLLFRANYYRFLEHSVVQMMVDARSKMERLNNCSLDIYYHSTWAESPTCDAWAIGGVHGSWSAEEHRRKYEYTPDFLWSNTVHQAAAACADQFAWNDYLTGGNDDTPEGGYADRNYYGRVLACSLAALNRRPLASAGMWGMPPPVSERMFAVSQVYGALGHPAFRAVEDYAPRQIEALFVYPNDLVAVDERFGSWMVQYGYANLISTYKLEELGKVMPDGTLDVNGWRYRAVGILYQPFPSTRLLDLLAEFAQAGGTVVWTSIPPLLDREGSAAARERAADLFGVRFEPTPDPLGLPLPGRQVNFEGSLAVMPGEQAGVAPMTILTDFPVDRVFPVTPLGGTETIATLRTGGAPRTRVVGTFKRYGSGGQAVYLGFRPRDDQAASTGMESATWFEILAAFGAYPRSLPGGADLGANDNPTVISRTTQYLAAAFPNGAIGLCPHYRTHEESWPGGFFRNEEIDVAAIEANPVPDDAIELDRFRVAGDTVTYRGRHAVVWRKDAAGHLVGFSGIDSSGITLDGTAYAWADEPVSLAWHPLKPEHETSDYRPLYRIWCGSEAQLSVPLNLAAGVGLELWVGAYEPMNTKRRRREGQGRAGYGERQLPLELDADGNLVVDYTEDLAGHWLYVVEPKKQA